MISLVKTLRLAATSIQLLQLHSPLRLPKNIKRLIPFLRDYRELKRQVNNQSTPFMIDRFYPCIDDRFQESGAASGHYFHQDLWTAARIFKNNPRRHVDIGSRIDGFVAHVAAFREIEVFDIRNLSNTIPNIRFIQADIMSDSFNMSDYCDSLSSLHVIEHLGLGRYGDKVDCQGHLKGLKNMLRLLERGGKFYCATPIGRQRIEFNAHRVFDVQYLLELFQPILTIDRFVYVDDQGELYRDVSLYGDDAKTNFGCRYGCGIFEMTKR